MKFLTAFVFLAALFDYSLSFAGNVEKNKCSNQLEMLRRMIKSSGDGGVFLNHSNLKRLELSKEYLIDYASKVTENAGVEATPYYEGIDRLIKDSRFETKDSLVRKKNTEDAFVALETCIQNT